MVDRYVSPPVELPDPQVSFVRADLVFYGIDHSGSSFEAQITLGDEPAGAFWIFGHGGCFGDVGHCDIPEQVDRFDLRPPHQLLPATRVVTVTEPVQRLVAAGLREVPVTVVAVTPGNRSNKVLEFDTVRLLSYA
jgi:tyrosinase